MSDEPTRRIPPADDPTQIQRPPARPGRPGAQPDAPSSYAATQRFDAVRDGQAAGQTGQAAWQAQGDGDHTQVMPPSGMPQGNAGYGDHTQVIPPSGMPQPDQGRDFRTATPPPARPYRPYETGQPTQAHAPGAFPGEQDYGQGQAGYGQQQGYGQQPNDQGYNPQAPRPTPPTPRRDRSDDSPGGGSAVGAVLAWIPRILLALSVYQLIRLIPGFDVMPDTSQLPLFRGLGDGVLGMLNLNPEWSDQAANLTIPVLGIALAGLFNTIRSLSTSLAIWPYALAIVAWIVVFAVGGIVGYAQDATTDMRENVQESVDESVEDAKDEAKESVEKQVEQGVEDAKQNATENLEDALPGGNG
ncbi:hypothetical protein APR04_005001 [Promicromonospora umidemergens]|uniref:Uncharacterized protein n=1 Tax=Promicromonospora umidemergens TaxID=629679 RepID=A0ABP8XV07_9MICO|nr:hypothetical protein [Promicromonospora umidemergens]MCP2286065.1 hypothetical protein [Promicromonospora umidemergens]